jgi:hypothetical protein
MNITLPSSKLYGINILLNAYSGVSILLVFFINKLKIKSRKDMPM